ncbi:MAG: substrate-binding domain-containing protein [Chloroflexota bacterium]
MRRRRSITGGLAALLALAIALPAAAQDASPAPLDLEAATVGPNGEASTAAGDLAPLTDDEIAQIRAGGHSAALLWAGAGTWYNALTAGARDAAERLGIEIVTEAEANFDPARQATDVETALALRPDIILTLPVDPVSAAQAFRPAVDAGAKLVFVDNGIDGYAAGTEYVTVVTGDHFGMGKTAADLMAEAIGGSGEIGFIFHDADYYVTNNRDRYFKAAIEQRYPDITIAAEQGFAEEGRTQEIAAAMLAQNPDLDGIYVAWSSAAQGVVAALREAGKTDVKVVAYDLDAVNDLDMAQCGNMYAVALDWPYLEGQLMIEVAARSLLGQSVPPFITVPVQTETRPTILQVWAENVHADPPQEIVEALETEC